MQENYNFTEKIDIKVFSSDKKLNILLTPLFIVTGAKKEETLISTESNEAKNNNVADKSEVIHLDTIDDIKFCHGSSDLNLNYHKDGKLVHSCLDFENEQVRTEFVNALNLYINNAFESETLQCTRIEAAVGPLGAALILAVVGPILTFVVNAVHNYEPTGTRILKSYVAIFYALCKLIGPYPVAIVSAILFLLCIISLITNLINPPMKTVMKRKAVL